MNKSATTIPAAVTAVGIAAIYAIGEWLLKSESFMLITGIVIVIAGIATVATWAAVELFKRKFDPETRARLNRPYRGKVRDPDWKRRDQVYFFAVITGFLLTEAMGSVFLLMDGATRNMIIVVVVFWTVFAATVGMLIPILYRKLFYKKFDPEVLL